MRGGLDAATHTGRFCSAGCGKALTRANESGICAKCRREQTKAVARFCEYPDCGKRLRHDNAFRLCAFHRKTKCFECRNCGQPVTGAYRGLCISCGKKSSVQPEPKETRSLPKKETVAEVAKRDFDSVYGEQKPAPAYQSDPAFVACVKDGKNKYMRRGFRVFRVGGSYVSCRLSEAAPANAQRVCRVLSDGGAGWQIIGEE